MGVEELEPALECPSDLIADAVDAAPRRSPDNQRAVTPGISGQTAHPPAAGTSPPVRKISAKQIEDNARRVVSDFIEAADRHLSGEPLARLQKTAICAAEANTILQSLSDPRYPEKLEDARRLEREARGSPMGQAEASDQLLPKKIRPLIEKELALGKRAQSQTPAPLSGTERGAIRETIRIAKNAATENVILWQNALDVNRRQDPQSDHRTEQCERGLGDAQSTTRLVDRMARRAETLVNQLDGSAKKTSGSNAPR
jgi:hypothetical protein